MQILKTARLVLLFYRSFFVATNLITASCIAIFYQNGLESFFAIFWFKLITLALIYYFMKSIKAKQFYYYQNLGVSKVVLWTSAFALDFVLFIISLIITHQIK